MGREERKRWRSGGRGGRRKRRQKKEGQCKDIELPKSKEKLLPGVRSCCLKLLSLPLGTDGGSSWGLSFLLFLAADVRSTPQLLTTKAAQCGITDDVRVDLSNCNLTAVPPFIPKSTCYLDLSHNRIFALQSTDLALLSDLCILRMMFCALSYISPDAFRGNPKLQELYLSSNKLNFIPELPALSQLSILDLSDNVYESYALRKSTHELKSLVTLSLGSPNATRINCSNLALLKGLPLKRLTLRAGVVVSGYQLGSLSQLVQLEELTLNLTFCECQQAFTDILRDLASTRLGRLTVVRFLPSLFNVFFDLLLGLRNLTQLRWLMFRDVWFNSSVLVQTISNVIQSPIEALIFLNMTYKEDTADGFQLFDIATHSRLGRLKAMVFNHYIYHSFHYPFKYPEVQELDLSNNILLATGLWYGCPDTDIFPALSSLVLRSNSFDDLSVVASKIGSVKHLKKLDLSFNPVKLQSCPSLPSSLCYFSLSGSDLGQNVLGHLSPNFLFVNLSQASIESLDTDSLLKLTHLKTLVLSSNSIEELPLNRSLPELEQLYVDNNKISTFHLRSFKGLPKLKRVHGGRNHFVCDCDLHTFLTQFNTSMLPGWPFDYRCHFPDHLAGTLLKDFHPSMVFCNLWIQASISLAVVLVMCVVLAWIFRAIGGAWYLRMLCVWLAVKRRSQRDARRLVGAMFHFVRSEWCNYELFFSQHRALGERCQDSLAFVLLEPIPPDSLPRKFLRLRTLLRQQTYLQWPQEKHKCRLFCASLRAVLGCTRGTLALRQAAEKMRQLCHTTHKDDTQQHWLINNEKE
ncbi:hypothetical protein ACEWY4_010253 [Coilia grayii]|uniref:LRRCT domain-containing protein n=1 Tax=Coilia grayii TaxID=363190 RepID=A0ABD1K1J7_9TELE